jgi:hypothetical protein
MSMGGCLRRDQATSTPQARSSPRLRLRSSARAPLHFGCFGIAPRSASTAWLSRTSTPASSRTKRACQRRAALSYFSGSRSASSRVSSSASTRSTTSISVAAESASIRSHDRALGGSGGRPSLARSRTNVPMAVKQKVGIRTGPRSGRLRGRTETLLSGPATVTAWFGLCEAVRWGRLRSRNSRHRSPRRQVAVIVPDDLRLVEN